MGFGPSTSCSIRLNSSLSPDERARFQDTEVIQRVLSTAKTIAVLGLSAETTKASNMVASYLLDEGYEVIPVNPRVTEVLGRTCFPSLAAYGKPVDVVLAFRPADEIPKAVDQALEVGAKTLWLQLKIVNVAAGDRALAGGLEVVMDKCMKMEHGRFNGTLHWAGMNTELISAKRRQAAK